MGHRSEITSFHIDILYHIIQCDSELETVSHISEGIGSLHPAVFRATKTLIQKGYLQKLGGPSKGKKREIILTDKALALFILAKRQYKELAQYLRKTVVGRNAVYNRERFRLFDAVILLSETPSPNEFQHLRSALDFMLTHGWFEYEETKLPDQKEIKELQYTTITGGYDVWSTFDIFKPDPTEFVIIVQLIDRFSINVKPYVKTVLANVSLRTSLQGYQEYTRDIINELDRKETIIPELDETKHKVFMKDIKKIIDDVETDKKLLESV
ncbi:MAG: MarR family winged helix-turn-helix transcriptional regulator [Nitrososphaeraceae archaeon]